MTRHMTRPRVAMAVWRWLCGGGRVAVTWPVTWPGRITRTCDSNHRFIALYILYFNLLFIIFYLGGSIMRGANALIAADYLNRFSNGSLSVVRVTRDSNTFFGQTLLWPLASLSLNSTRNPAGDLWRYLVTRWPWRSWRPWRDKLMVWRNELKVVREKSKGLWGIIKSRCHGLTYPLREGPVTGYYSYHISPWPTGIPS